jgi:hypothetical protein
MSANDGEIVAGAIVVVNAITVLLRTTATLLIIFYKFLIKQGFFNHFVLTHFVVYQN